MGLNGNVEVYGTAEKDLGALVDEKQEKLWRELRASSRA